MRASVDVYRPLERQPDENDEVYAERVVNGTESILTFEMPAEGLSRHTSLTLRNTQLAIVDVYIQYWNEPGEPLASMTVAATYDGPVEELRESVKLFECMCIKD